MIEFNITFYTMGLHPGRLTAEDLNDIKIMAIDSREAKKKFIAKYPWDTIYDVTRQKNEDETLNEFTVETIGDIWTI